MFNLTRAEMQVFKKLTTPVKIQNYLDTIPMNFEKKGDTHYSPRGVLEHHTAHCIEGALLAAAALWVHGEEPLIMDMIAEEGDDDHVIALYKKNGYWGAISKTNHATIRFRDPVYKTPRELALSYFHEWFRNTDGKKTLRSYSSPFNLKKLGERWVTAPDIWFVGHALDRVPHHDIAPAKNLKLLRKADLMELKAGRLTEWKEKSKKLRRVLETAVQSIRHNYKQHQTRNRATGSPF